MKKINKLKPFINEKIWGGERLKELKQISHAGKIGETWEVSTHPDGPSLLEETDTPIEKDLSYLVKFINAEDNLSIQVHPDDDYAKKHEKDRGKTECWLILDAHKDAGIYLGFKAGVTKKEFFNAVEAGLACDHFLNFIPVKPGDFFFLPPGSVHAIGKGITLCEIQQSSGITYRVWDWNRIDSDGNARELHIDKARDVLNFNEDFNKKLINSSIEKLLDTVFIEKIARHEDFEVEMFSKYQKEEIDLNLKAYTSIIVLNGKLDDLGAYEAAIVDEAGSYHFKTEPGSTFLLVSGK